VNWPVVLDVISVVLMLTGCLLAVVAGVGLVRFPDVLARLHAGTKPQVTGVVLIVAGAVLRLEGSSVVSMLVLAAMLQLLTAPVSAHLIARVGYRREQVREDLLVRHEVGYAGLEEPEEPGEPEGDQPADAPPEGR
jgi:multicomponent Na+:H+ antiporter subunit G